MTKLLLKTSKIFKLDREGLVGYNTDIVRRAAGSVTGKE
jgi:hypothetical protein